MTTQSSFLAVRAIGAEFARGLWWSALITALILSALSIALLLWLVSLSGWWWLLAAPIGIAMSVVTALLIVFHLLIRHVRPKDQTSEQKMLVSSFVNKLRFVSEITGTPKFIMLFRTIRSIAAPKSDTYLQEIFETKNLRKDFQAIAASFKNN